MSDENSEQVSAEEIAALARTCAKIKAKCASGQTDDIPNETVTALLSAATMLYAFATHECGRTIEPFQSAEITATSVVVTVKAMLEAAGLSSFDLAMWSNRLPSSGPLPSS